MDVLGCDQGQSIALPNAASRCASSGSANAQRDPANHVSADEKVRVRLARLEKSRVWQHKPHGSARQSRMSKGRSPTSRAAAKSVISPHQSKGDPSRDMHRHLTHGAGWVWN